MAAEDDDKPRKKITHEIGQDLYLLSVEELGERIALLTSEIERLKEAMTKKRSSKDAAEQFFQIVRTAHTASSRRDAAAYSASSPRRRGPITPGVADQGRPLLHCRNATTRRMGPRLRGDDEGALGQWPTWQTIAESNRSFTID